MILETSAGLFINNSPSSVVLWKIKVKEPDQSGKIPCESHSLSKMAVGAFDECLCLPQICLVKSQAPLIGY